MASAFINLGKDFYVIFGTSSGKIFLSYLNLHKRRLENVKDMQNDSEYKAAVLCVKSVSIGQESLVVIGLTNGDIVIKLLKQTESVSFTTILCCKNAHAFGVNCLDLL